MSEVRLEEIKKLCNDVVGKIKIQAEAIESKIERANEYEFKVSDYLIKWTIIIIPLYMGLIKVVKIGTISQWYIIIWPFVAWILSLIFGLTHSMKYRQMCYDLAKNLDKKVSERIKKYHGAKSVEDILAIQREFHNEEQNSTIIEGSLIYLRLQFYSFIFGAFLLFICMVN